MSVNMALDDIIAANKKSKSGRDVGGFRSDGVKRDTARSSASGAKRSYGRFSDRVPSGQWKHDKFAEVANERRGNREGRSGIADRISAGAGGNPNKKVTVNLTSLGPDVVSADLEELFEPYTPELVTVHFNEVGESLCTGSVALKKKDALKMLQDFKGVSLDGHLIKMVILDGTTAVAGTSIKSRLQFNRPSVVSNKSPRGGVQKKFRKRSRSPAHFLDRMTDNNDKPLRREGRAAGNSRGSRGGAREKKVAKTDAELDAELEAYMNKSNKGKPMEQ